MNGYINTLDGLLPMQTVVTHILESSYLIENSNSPDTVIGRCNLLKQNVGHIRECREQPDFNIELQTAIDQYKRSYYDKPITQTQISLLLDWTLEQYKNFYFINIERSLYNYLDSQINEIRSLKKETAIQKRKEKSFSLINSCNIEMLRLFFVINVDNPFIDKVEKLTKTLTFYFSLKTENFDESIPVIVNGQYYYDENTAPVNMVASKIIKEMKSKLWTKQFEIRNQDAETKLIVHGNNVQLGFGENATEEFMTNIKSLFDKRN